MSRIPRHGGRESVAAFVRAGLKVIRKKGSHSSLWREGCKRPVVIQHSKKELPEFHVMNNLRVAGISKKEYIYLLKNEKKKAAKEKAKQKAAKKAQLQAAAKAAEEANAESEVSTGSEVSPEEVPPEIVESEKPAPEKPETTTDS
jgi:predicted RNA binding protein YcfA (HicA-like mRNA interferase family)